MRLFFFLITGFVLSLHSSAQNKAGVVKLKGRLSNFGAVVTLEDFSDMQLMVPKSFNQVIVPDKDSTFSIEVPLSAPRYFRLGRSKLYLSPGDNLEVHIDHHTSVNAVFKGKGSVANTYLRNVPFPKSGSYLESGKYIQATPAEMLTFIKEQRSQRDKELTSLRGVSKEFITLEKARNRADAIKSISSVRNYAMVKFSKEPKEKLQAYTEEFSRISKSYKDSLLKNFIDPSFLQIETYRDISDDLDLKNSKPSDRQIFEDWKKSFMLAFVQIKPQNDKSKIPGYQVHIDSIKTKKYRDVLNLLVKDKLKFGNGDPAIDFVVTNSDGSKTSLASLKGKVIYIDLWATWCGPCLAEMPHFEELKKKYTGNNNIAIVSLSIDDNDAIWLKNLNQRKPEGIQWRIDRPKLDDYGVESIPRYILIDKNFKIAEMNAPRSADPGLPATLQKLLNEKV